MDIDWARFETVGKMELDEAAGRVAVSVEDSPAAQLEGVVYAWLDGQGNVLRVGSSKQPVRSRLRPYQSDINKRLSGLPSSTAEWEAAAWLRLVTEGSIRVVVHQPDLVETVAGPVRPYLDIERAMIAALKPPLNRSHR